MAKAPEKWIPDPRTCRNCEGVGIILDWDDGDTKTCLDCEGTGTEYRDLAAVQRRRGEGG